MIARYFSIIRLWVAASAIGAGQSMAATPEKNPEGNTGALKSQITTGGSYDAHSGNATRSVEDIHVPNALGAYGLNLTRHWNSLLVDHDNPYTTLPTSFGSSGWSHSWEWQAIYAEEGPEQDAEGGGAEGTQRWTTSITITFPDGHASKYKITRVNQGYPGHAGGVGWGPPYSAAEQNGFLTGGFVYDYLSDMAADGSEFWLYRADGGAVHFVNGPSGYLAKEVYDPQGLITSLTYNGPEGRLSDVVQEGGRSLHFTWGDFGVYGSAITAINTSGPCGYQSVSYGYTTVSSRSGMTWLVLATVTYPNERSIGQTTSATYFYDCFYDLTDGKPSLYPMLKTADDPHYAGPMTKIHYSYRGTECLHDTGSPHLNFYAAPKEAIKEELSPSWDIVSSFSIDCLNGTRTERNGINGWRLFNYGSSAGQPGAFHCLAYQLGRLTDFTNQSSYGGVPYEAQSFMNGQPREIWDGRGIKTEAVVTPGDASGKPGEIRHVGSDNSVEKFNRVNPGSSEARDPYRIPNRYNRWLFSHQDERGLTTTYRRDSRRRVLDITYADGSSEHFTYTYYNQVETHTLPSLVNGQHPVVHYDYDGNQRLVREWNDVDGVNDATIYTYDALERVETVSHPWSRAKGAAFSVKMTYNGRHQVVREEYPATNPGANPFKTYGYDPYGNCVAITDELGHSSSYTYDFYRRCTSYTEPVNAPDGFGNTIGTRRWDWLYDRVIEGIGGFGAYAHTGKIGMSRSNRDSTPAENGA